jgi:hypothetical protein
LISITTLPSHLQVPTSHERTMPSTIFLKLASFLLGAIPFRLIVITLLSVPLHIAVLTVVEMGYKAGKYYLYSAPPHSFVGKMKNNLTLKTQTETSARKKYRRPTAFGQGNDSTASEVGMLPETDTSADFMWCQSVVEDFAMHEFSDIFSLILFWLLLAIMRGLDLGRQTVPSIPALSISFTAEFSSEDFNVAMAVHAAGLVVEIAMAIFMWWFLMKNLSARHSVTSAASAVSRKIGKPSDYFFAHAVSILDSCKVFILWGFSTGVGCLLLSLSWP